MQDGRDVREGSGEGGGGSSPETVGAIAGLDGHLTVRFPLIEATYKLAQAESSSSRGQLHTHGKHGITGELVQTWSVAALILQRVCCVQQYWHAVKGEQHAMPAKRQ